MGWRIVTLVAVFSLLVAVQPRTAEAQWWPGGPYFLPRPPMNFQFSCKDVDCGKGNCTILSNHTETSKNNTGGGYSYSYSYTFSYGCTCQPGWNQSSLDPRHQYLPCVIPKCTFNPTCSQNLLPPTRQFPLPQLPFNPSNIDPCQWATCGGGNCVKTSTFSYQCKCNPGFSNLLNITSLPCYKECGLGPDCAKIPGLMRTSNSSLPTGSNGGSGGGRSKATTTTPGKLLALFISMLLLAMS